MEEGVCTYGQDRPHAVGAVAHIHGLVNQTEIQWGVRKIILDSRVLRTLSPRVLG